MIATVTHVISGLGDGGAEAVLFRLCKTDTSCRHRVISLMDDGKYGAALRQIGVDVQCLHMPRGRITLRGVVRLYRLLRAHEPNVLQTWMYHGDLIGGLAGRLARVRKVFWGVHNSGLDRATAKARTLWIYRLNALLSFVVPTAIVCCAQQAFDAHAQVGYRKRRMVVITNGYDLSQFTPSALARNSVRSELQLDNATPVLGMVARFDPAKDHRNLILALGLLHRRGLHFRVLLVGSGITAENVQLTQWLIEAGVHDGVLLLGQRSDVPAIMNGLDIAVLSSRSEAFPNVLAEAMACETPCVTTAVGDAASIVGDTGWVVPPQSPDALADALSNALAERSDARAWSERKLAARRRIEERYAVERMVADYHRVWFASTT